MIRWKCNSCNKIWIYPIKKCLYCKGAIERFKVTPKKIIGVTKVNVPSPLHPIVPYNVILLEDEQGNRLPRKTMKQYRVGEEFTEKNADTDNAVSKSVNLPEDSHKDDIVRIFKTAYGLGCKGITVYRDKSRENQIINPLS